MLFFATSYPGIKQSKILQFYLRSLAHFTVFIIQHANLLYVIFQQPDIKLPNSCRSWKDCPPQMIFETDGKSNENHFRPLVIKFLLFCLSLYIILAFCWWK